MACSLTMRHGRVPLSQAVDVHAAYLQREFMPQQALDNCIWSRHTLLSNGFLRFVACVT